MLADRGLAAADDAATIAFGAVGAVYRLGLKALVVPTLTGRTARLLSAYRPNVPILALCPTPKVVRECSLLWGVDAELHAEPYNPLQLLKQCGGAAVRRGIAAPGDKIGILAGVPAGRAGGTNLFNIHTVS